MIVLDRIPLEDVEQCWAWFEADIIAACNAVTTEITPEFIYAEALAGRRTLWAIIDTEDFPPLLAAFATGERLTSRGRVVFIDGLGGREMKRWLGPCLADLEAQAKAMGAVSIEIEGRRGWRRVLPGYRETRVTLEKDL